jgi:hypothetical protein
VNEPREEEEEGEEKDGGRGDEEEKPKSKSVWRKSWENLVGLVRSGSVTRDDEDQDQDRSRYALFFRVFPFFVLPLLFYFKF